MSYANDIKESAQVLKDGGIILYPTDTIWGIGCDATNEIAVAKIYKLKKRDEKKSMIILFANENDIPFYSQMPSPTLQKILSQTLSPLTIIYPAAKNLAANLINEDGTIAIRVVKDVFCLDLLNAFGNPIVSTSANISGDNSPENFMDIPNALKNNVDFIVQHRQQEEKLYKPSKIIKWLGDDAFVVIRE